MSEPVLTNRVAHPADHGRFADGLLRPESRKFAVPYGWLRGPWLNVALFLLTLASTTVFGFAAALGFRHGRGLDDENILEGYRLLFHGSGEVWAGLAYSLPLLLILLFHEFGHYFTCQRRHVKATLPYFAPSPTLLGTLGAFISIRSPIYGRRGLFDIGISGPMAGFTVTLPFLFIGVWKSRVCSSAAGMHGMFSFGTPLLLRLLEAWRFPGVSPHQICLHPMALAAWAGLLATAINLLPVGQLDGGHILYAALGARGHSLVSRTTVGLLALAGFFYWPWWIWAVGMFFLRRHPLTYDAEPLGKQRRLLAAAAVILFLLSFSVVPVRVG